MLSRHQRPRLPRDRGSLRPAGRPGSATARAPAPPRGARSIPARGARPRASAARWPSPHRWRDKYATPSKWATSGSALSPSALSFSIAARGCPASISFRAALDVRCAPPPIARAPAPAQRTPAAPARRTQRDSSDAEERQRKSARCLLSTPGALPSAREIVSTGRFSQTSSLPFGHRTSTRSTRARRRGRSARADRSANSSCRRPAPPAHCVTPPATTGRARRWRCGSTVVPASFSSSSDGRSGSRGGTGRACRARC